MNGLSKLLYLYTYDRIYCIQVGFWDFVLGFIGCDFFLLRFFSDFSAIFAYFWDRISILRSFGFCDLVEYPPQPAFWTV